MMRQPLFLLAILMPAMPLPAAELAGQLSLDTGDGRPYCVPLGGAAPAGMHEYCFASVRLSWRMDTVANTPLLRYAAELVPVTAGYDVDVVALDMSAYVFPGSAAAPPNPAGSNMGLAVPLESVTVRRANDPASLSTPAGHSWDSLFADVTGNSPCTPNDNGGSPVFVPGYVSRGLVSEGVTLGGLAICRIELGNVRARVQDEGVSIDDLLAGVIPADADSSADAVVDTDADTDAMPGRAGLVPPAGDDEFEAMLSGLEDDIHEARDRRAHEAALAAEAEKRARCESEADEADEAFRRLIDYLNTPGEVDVNNNVDDGGDCSAIVARLYSRIDELSRDQSSMISGNTVRGQLHSYREALNNCASDRKSRLKKFDRAIRSVNLGGCEFSGGHPLDGLDELRSQVREETEYLEDQADLAEEADDRLMEAALAQVGARNAAWLDAMFPHRDETVLEMTQRIDERNAMRRQREQARRAWTAGQRESAVSLTREAVPDRPTQSRGAQSRGREISGYKHGVTCIYREGDAAGEAECNRRWEAAAANAAKFGSKPLEIDNGESCLDRYTEIDDLNRCYMESLDSSSGTRGTDTSGRKAKTQ